MKQRVEDRLRILEARVALLEPAVKDGFATVDVRTQADLLAEKLTRTNGRILRGVPVMVLTSTTLAVLSVVLTSGR